MVVRSPAAVMSASSPKKVVRGNVLNAAKQKAQEHAEPADAKQEEAMGQQPSADAPTKSKSKRTRWGPDQLVNVPVTTSQFASLSPRGLASDGTPGTSISPPAQTDKGHLLHDTQLTVKADKCHALNGNQLLSPPVRSTAQEHSVHKDASRSSSRNPSRGPSSHFSSEAKPAQHSLSPERRSHHSQSRGRLPRNHDRSSTKSPSRVSPDARQHSKPPSSAGRQDRHASHGQRTSQQAVRYRSPADTRMQSDRRTDTRASLSRGHDGAEHRHGSHRQGGHYDRRDASRDISRRPTQVSGRQRDEHNEARDVRRAARHHGNHRRPRSNSASLEPHAKKSRSSERHGRQSRDSTPAHKRSPSHQEEGQINEKPPAQPPLPEPISFKIAQRSTRQLNLDPESPDTKPLLTPLPELHPAIPPQLATAAQPAVCQPAADVSGAVSHPDIQQPPPAAPAAMLASTLPQLPATASQAELHRLGHAHMMVAPTQAYTGRSATAALGPGLELDPTSSVPTTNMLPNPDAQSIAAVGEGRHDQHAVAQAQAELRSISPTLPDKMAAEQRTHTGEAAVHTAAASHSVPSPTRKRPARAAADIEKSDDAGNRQRPAQDPEASDDLSDRLIHHNRAMPDSRRNSQDRPYMPEEPRLAHRPYTGSRPDSLSKAPIHSKATPHDKHQPHSYQPERSRAPRRFSDTPSVLRSPDRKRSREPERAPVQDLSKRLRTDPWQPVMPSQAPHHRHLDIRNAKREANHLAAVRRQEERDSSQSLSPSSDRHGQLLNGHAPRHVPNSRFAVHQEHSMSISPSAPHPQASPVPESSSARSGQRQRASESGYPPSGVYANGYLQDASRESMRDPIRSCKKDTSRGPPAHFQDPSLRRNSSWSTVDPHSGADSCVARNYSNYGRHPQLSALEAHRSPSSHSVHEQDPLDRRHSSLHSSDAATPHADRHRNSVSESMLQTAHEGQLDRAGSDRASRHRSLGSFDRSQDQNATHWQHTHDTSPKADQRRHGYTSAALRHAPYRQTEERSRLQMQQHSEAAKQAAAVKLGADMDRWLDKLCQSYGMPASAVGNGPMLKNQERSGLLDLMSAAVSAIEEIDPVLFTITYARLPSWLPEARQQQLQTMLVPATWLLQDASFRPEWQVPTGWEPPGCTDDSHLAPTEPLDPHIHLDCDCAKNAGLLADSNPYNNVEVPWLVADPEAGELESPKLSDPRPSPAAAPVTLVLPLPLFPFLPGKSDLPVEQSGDFAERGLEVDAPLDQLAPGGFLHALWDMDDRPPSPAGSWATSLTHKAEEVDGLEDNHSVQPMSLEPPAAPGHVLSTDQQYTNELHTTDPAGYAHSHQPPTTGYPPHVVMQHPHAADRQQYPPQQQPHMQAYSQPYPTNPQPHEQALQHPYHMSQQQQQQPLPHFQHQLQYQQPLAQQQHELTLGLVPPPPPSRPPPPECPPAPQLRRPTHYPEPEAGRYKYQLAVDEKQDMSSSVHSLMLLRDWLKDGRAGLVPGMSVFDEGNNLWLPLQQGRWTTDQLHWGGIDHMLLQGQPATAEACTPVAALSDSDLDDWLHHTSAQAVQRAQARHSWCQASAAPATAAAAASTVSPQPIPAPVSAVPAATSTQQHVALQQVSPAPEAADTSSIPEGSQAQAMQVDADQNLLGMSAAAEAWFDSFETMQPAQFGQGSVFEVGGGRGKARCWGPPLPAHLPAMLRGTLAQAVLGGIAGKSLVNQMLDKAIQQVLDKRK